MNAALKTLGLQALDTAARLLLGALWRRLKAAVELHDLTDLSGAEKREQVFAIARRDADASGLALADSLINFGIEAAVQWVRWRAHG